MYILAVLGFLASQASTSPPPRTFGLGIPNHPFGATEVEIFSYNLTKGDDIGVVNHL